MYRLILHTFDKAKYPELLRYCQAASERDPTFKFEVLPDRIIVECPDRNTGFRRGIRIHALFNCYFEVVWERGTENE
jgi:hypothetical protein